MRRIECDILIIGSGAAGGVLAATLADSKGKRIVLVEKGGHFGKEFFNQREWDMNALYAGDGVRKRINVHVPPDDAVNGNNRVLEDGCRAMGFSSKPFQLNMRDCRRCGYCAQGCSYDSKMGTAVTYIPDALAKGVSLVHHCDIETLEWKKSGGGIKVSGAVGRVRPTRPGSMPNPVDPGPVRFAAKVGVETMFAGGAKEVVLPSEEAIGPLAYPRFTSPDQAMHCAELRFTPHQTTITSAHCQATVKMGEDPGRSMVNSRGESHFMSNLMV